MTVMEVLETQIRVEPDPLSGEPSLLVQATAVGVHLAGLLAPDAIRQTEGFRLAHTPEVDARLRALIEALVAVRYAQPGLLQLTLWEEVDYVTAPT